MRHVHHESPVTAPRLTRSSRPFGPLRRSPPRGASLVFGRACPSRGVVPQWHAFITTARRRGSDARRIKAHEKPKTEKNTNEMPHAETSNRGISGNGAQKTRRTRTCVWETKPRRRVHAVGTEGGATRRPEVTRDRAWSTTEHRKPTYKTNIESHPR